MAYTFLIIVVLIIASFFLSKPKFNRHKNNVRRGNIALTKVNSIEYDGQKINYGNYI